MIEERSTDMNFLNLTKTTGRKGVDNCTCTVELSTMDNLTLSLMIRDNILIGYRCAGLEETYGISVNI